MRKLILFLSLVFPAGFIFAQDPNQDTGDGPVTMNNLAGLLRTQLTITPAWSVTAKSGNNSGSIAGGRTNVYLHGTVEYYFDERFSMRGDGYYFVNKMKTPGGMKNNHTLEVGGSWHLWKGSMIDPFIGLGAGISYVQIQPADITNGAGLVLKNYAYPAHLDPVWGPRAGVNFFSAKVFHFFVEAQYVMGSYRPSEGPILSLNEVRVSAGLGWNWVLLHKEKTLRPTI
ncbi:MAG TPA: hypothetical protein VFU15_06740 [Bacteroidia bacterium]|nr:hypothetical protein [Bacteroidia bacterium]